MPDFDLTGELSLKIEMHMLRPITEKVHSGNGPVSLVGYGARSELHFLLSGTKYEILKMLTVRVKH